MNERQLDELLEQKKNSSIEFNRSEAEFTKDFLEKVENRPFPAFHIWRYAAGILLPTAAVFAIFITLWRDDPPEKADSVSDPFVNINEAVRLFGNDSAVVFFGDELVTGSRESSMKMENYVNVLLQAGKDNLQLSLICSDNDSIYLDGPDVFGNVVISRSDDSTLVLDMELTIKGKKTHAIIPAVRHATNRYLGKSFS